MSLLGTRENKNNSPSPKRKKRTPRDLHVKSLFIDNMKLLFPKLFVTIFGKGTTDGTRIYTKNGTHIFLKICEGLLQPNTIYFVVSLWGKKLAIVMEQRVGHMNVNIGNIWEHCSVLL
jgi:hypothetical protein